MNRIIFLFILTFASKLSYSQKIEGIFFNLYTDSLKKGFYNYISVDGRDTKGHWLPLDSSHLIFTCNTGYFKGNDLFIDSSYKGETVLVKAVLKGNSLVWKEATIYIRKRPFTEPLKTNEEILNEMKVKRKKK